MSAFLVWPLFLALTLVAVVVLAVAAARWAWAGLAGGTLPVAVLGWGAWQSAAVHTPSARHYAGALLAAFLLAIGPPTVAASVVLIGDRPSKRLLHMLSVAAPFWVVGALVGALIAGCSLDPQCY